MDMEKMTDMKRSKLRLAVALALVLTLLLALAPTAWGGRWHFVRKRVCV